MLKRILKILTGVAFLIVVLIASAGYVFFLYGRGLPEYDYLKTYEAPVLSRLYSADGQLVSEYAVEKRLFVPFHLIPEQLKLAFLAAEDKNFFYHFGVDVISTLRASIINTLTNGWQQRPGGASTITQQVAKNFLIGNERSFSRKAKEAITSFRLERALPKERIFELYLNQIYLGAGAYGVAAAALIYFDKELDQLSLDEMAFLAALPKAPTALINKQELARIIHRRNWVINRMMHLKMINSSQAEIAKVKQLQFRTHREYPVQATYFSSEVRRELLRQFEEKTVNAGGLTVKTTLDPKLQQMADKALQQGLIDYDRRHGWRGSVITLSAKDLENWPQKLSNLARLPGMKNGQFAVILTTEPHKVQIGLINGEKSFLSSSSIAWAQPTGFHPGDVILVDKVHTAQTQRSLTDDEYMRTERLFDFKNVIFPTQQKAEDYKLKNPFMSYSWPQRSEDLYELQQIPQVSGAIVVMDPHSGRVLAISGGYDFEMNQFNCATQAKRQSGSAFKPFVYLAALEKGMTSETKILDGPISVSLGAGRGFYSPQNYTRRYYGLCPLRVGLEQSRNVMTIRLAQRMGMNRIIKIAKDFGIQHQMPRQLAMVLGAGETTVLQLTAAYGILANGGYKITPRLIDSVQDRYGNTLVDDTNKLKGELIASPASVKQLSGMLRGVVERGTAKRLQSLGFPVAGKTGTTNDYKDTWFVGYTDDLVIGVFVGFLSPKSLGEKETGAKVTVPIFEHFVKNAYADQPKPEFKDIRESDETEPVMDNIKNPQAPSHESLESDVHFVSSIMH